MDSLRACGSAWLRAAVVVGLLGLLAACRSGQIQAQAPGEAGRNEVKVHANSKRSALATF